jgi:hypothetical protein
VRPNLKKETTQKRVGGVSEGISPEFKPQNKKKEREREKGQNINSCHQAEGVTYLRSPEFKPQYCQK